MGNSEKTYWSESINLASTSEPKSIMRNQALKLGQITKNIVEANISTTMEYDEEVEGFANAPYYLHCFNLVAPILGYQKFVLFCVKQTIGVDFPLHFFSTYWEKKDSCECKSLEEFNKCLKEILSSDKTAELINSIIAQSSDD